MIVAPRALPSRLGFAQGRKISYSQWSSIEHRGKDIALIHSLIVYTMQRQMCSVHRCSATYARHP